MKVSRAWLQKYFEKPLPSAAEIANAFTFHAFEIEEAGEDLIDVKVLPNRAADCFSHRGIAKELSAILDIPLKSDPLRELLPEYGGLRNTHLEIEIEDPKMCLRYMGAVVRGVKVGPSPNWLAQALESVGQRSINNIVDAANYVMLNVGQPLHAFDAGKLKVEGGKWSVGVRSAKAGEKMVTLTGEEYTLTPATLVITDAHTDTAVGIAGTKGGKSTEVTTATTDLVIEAANFDGASVRRTAQTLKLFTDASQRFQNRPSPELVAYGMRDVLSLIQEIADGEAVGVVDIYPSRVSRGIVSVTLEKINGVLGSNFSTRDVEDVFRRLTLPYMEVKEGAWVVTPPFERTDITIPEDLVEEVGRIIGYDKVEPTPLPATSLPPDQNRFKGIERMKDQLVEQGFIEVSTQSFAETGDITLANPLDTSKPALRTSLEGNLKEALERAKRYAPLVLTPNEMPKLFEVGTVFSKEGEYLELRTVPSEAGAKEGDLDKIVNLEEYGKDYAPKRYELSAYKPFSAYPFIARDIAFWTPAGTEAEKPEHIIRDNAGNLLMRFDQFDRFEKEGRISYAYRLVFQSFDRTLTDDEVNGIMSKVSSALTTAGFEVR